MKEVEVKRFWKHLFGLRRNDRVKVTGGSEVFVGEIGTISQINRRFGSPRYLIKLDKYGTIILKEDELEWIPREESS